MKKITVLLLLMFVYSISQAWPWGHRYITEQADQNITVDINTSFRVSVEWGEGGWDADGSKFGYGTSTDGSDWTWVNLPWFEDGGGSNKRCRTDVSISIPGKYYYAYRMDKGGTSYSFGSDGWLENLETLSATSTIMVGEVSKAAGSWSTPGTWEDGTKPTSSDNVAIMHDVTISSSGEAKSIYVYSSKTFTIEDNGSVTITNNLTNNGTFTVQSNLDGTGSLITNGIVSGSVTSQRYITAYTTPTNGWHLLSSPVNNFAIGGSDFEPGTATPDLDDFFGWDEVGLQWLNQKVGGNGITNFVNGTGYLVSYETAETKSFSGTLNNSDITFEDLTKTTDKGEGWHLMGNPFQSALQWTNTDWVRTNIGAGAKVLNNGGSYDDISVGGTDIIPANQGFFIQASVHADNTFTIPESQRVHNSTAFYKNTIPNQLTLKVQDGEFYQQTWIQFMDGSTENYDENYDVRFLSGMSGVPKLYSIIGEDCLSTNRIPEPGNENVILLGFISQNETNISIQASGLESFAGYIKILLEDLKENTIVDLRENPEYSFNTNPEDNPERFRIHFKSTAGIGDNENSNILDIYSYNSNIYIINPNFINADIVVYNLMGQEVSTNKVFGEEFNSFHLNVKQGYYIVKVISEQSISTSKIYLK
jgi:hypothetical protein